MKLHVYQNAPAHIHDVSKRFPNSVPLSDSALKNPKLVQITDPKRCDFFYMGQFSRQTEQILLKKSNWPYLDQFPERHIVDIEGDWKFQETPGKEIPHLIDKCIITINSPDRTRFAGAKIFVHPNSSFFLWNGILKKDIPFVFPKKTSFFFRGKPDTMGTRERCKEAFKKASLPGTFDITPGFRGFAPIHSNLVKSFEKDIVDHSVCLCPRGTGPDSVRFYEVCAYGRVPVIIGNNILPAEGEHDFWWLFRLDYKSSVEEMIEGFQKVLNTPHAELEERGKAAKNYFDTIIRPYYKNPTDTFFKWMDRRGLFPEKA